MDRLSERWFKLIDTTIAIIVSFAFFWITLYLLINDEGMVSRYLNHLSNVTGNDGYSAISTILRIVGYIVDYVLFVMPFAVVGIIIRGDKIGDKKRFILRFILKFFVFWIYLFAYLIPY